jgi:hypothetical protein
VTTTNEGGSEAMSDETRTTHTIEEARAKFTLVDGVGDGEKTACPMSALGWMTGEEWGDSMPCAHLLIRSLVIRAADDSATTEEQRWAITEAGAAGGVVDTWWIPAEVVLWAISQAPREAGLVDQLLATLETVRAWKQTKERPLLAGAYLARAYLARAYLARANLARAYLADAYLARAYLAGAYLARANGVPRTGMPAGWKLNDAGLYVRDVD